MPGKILLKKIKKTFHHSKEKLGFIFYTHKQTYRCIYKVNLKNNSDKKRDLRLIIPTPPNTEHQKLLKKPIFSPGNCLLQKDEIFGNTYALWNVQLKPGEIKTYEQSFDIEVLPTYPILKKHLLKDYSQQLDIPNTSNSYIQANQPEIIKLAHGLKNTETNIIKIMKNLNSFVISYLNYKNPIPGLYSSREAFEKREVDCGGFDTFFCALSQALGIPARIVCGFWVGYKNNSMHAWAEFMLPNGKWIPVDPSVEQLFSKGLTYKSGRFGFTGSDRIIFSYGCDIPLLVHGEKVKTDILQNPLVYTSEGKQDNRIEKTLEFISEIT